MYWLLNESYVFKANDVTQNAKFTYILDYISLNGLFSILYFKNNDEAFNVNTLHTFFFLNNYFPL